MPPLRKKRPKKSAPSILLYSSAKNEDGEKQICVYAQCFLSGTSVGPIWGHSEQSVKKVLAILTRHCDCPARFHAAREYQGKKVTPKKKKPGKKSK